MLAMVLAAVVPAFAQQGIQAAAGGRGNDLIQQCQNNLNQTAVAANDQEINQNAANVGNVSGDQTNAQAAAQSANAAAANVNTGDLVNYCTQVVNNNSTVVNKYVNNKYVKVVGYTSYKKTYYPVYYNVYKNYYFTYVNKQIVYVNKNVIYYTVNVNKYYNKYVSPYYKAVSPYKSVSPYASASASSSASVSASAAPTLPSTGGASLIALGGGVLLVAGGLLARRIVR